MLRWSRHGLKDKGITERDQLRQRCMQSSVPTAVATKKFLGLGGIERQRRVRDRKCGAERRCSGVGEKNAWRDRS